MNNFYIPESAMAITAHPDDIEFSCAGTLARWAKAGTRVSYVLCTSGDVGIDEQGMTRERATQIREAESLAAAKLVGATEVIFLREPDGLLQPTLELTRAAGERNPSLPSRSGGDWRPYDRMGWQ